MAVTDLKDSYGSTNRTTPPSEQEKVGNGHVKEASPATPLIKNEDFGARALTNFQRFSYGVGHVLNDLTASMWFSYMLIFLQKVVQFENVLAGDLMLIGQVSDALCTPFVGLESDRTRGIWKLGKRKTWHAVGTFSVMASFVFLFSLCINCANAPSYAQFVYYTPFVIIFQFGWAATQISHLSFSSDITPYKHERVALQSIRNSFTVIANLSVYGLLSLLFYIDADADSDDISPADAPKFQQLAIICLGLGTLFNIIFYMGTRKTGTEENLTAVKDGPPIENSLEKSTRNASIMTWKNWLQELQFYQIALLYMATRLYINVSQVYFAMYLTETLLLNKSAIAILPLVAYLSSFVTSLLATPLNRLLGRKTSYVVALGIGAASCVWMYFIPELSDQVYGCAILMGSASSLLLITSLSMTSDLIGTNIESGAFVFGAMSFTDKLSNGVAVELIQYFHPCVNCCPACKSYYREVQTMVPGGALAIGFIALLLLLPQNIGVRNRRLTVLGQITYSEPLRYDDRDDDMSHSNGRLSPSSRSRTPIPPASNAVTHCAEVYNQFDESFHDKEDEEQRQPLMGTVSVNAQTADIGSK